MTTEDIVPGPTIRNTAQAREIEMTGLLMMAEALGGRRHGQIIEEQEAAGQSQFVRSEQLPTQTQNSDADFEALGFVFGAPTPGDSLFRSATLPHGWRRERTDHSMWSKLVDQHGRERVSVFYKAAFYDRDAFMRLVTPEGYLTSCLWDKTKPILDDQWLTVKVALNALGKMLAAKSESIADADRYADGGKDDYWVKRAAEHRAEAAEIEAMADRIRGGAL